MVAPDIITIIINLSTTISMCRDYSLFSPKGLDYSHFSNERNQ